MRIRNHHFISSSHHHITRHHHHHQHPLLLESNFDIFLVIRVPTQKWRELEGIGGLKGGGIEKLTLTRYLFLVLSKAFGSQV